LAAFADVNLGKAGREAPRGVLQIVVEDKKRTDAFIS
jgi:hypothetical protein